MSGYLVTGGAGFIGSHVAEALVARGDRVVILDNFDPGYPRELKARNLRALPAGDLCAVIEGDIRDAAQVSSLFADLRPEVVIHLAAKAGVRASFEAPAEYMDVNVRGTAQLLEGARRHGVRKLVFASSSSVYGSGGKVPFSEADPVSAPLSPYAASKIAGEACCHCFHHAYNIPIIALRFFTVYGPRQRPDMAISKFARLMSEGRPLPLFGDEGSERDYTYIGDVVRAVLLAVDAGLHYEVINIGGGAPIGLRGLIESLEQVMGRRAVTERLPAQPGDMPRTCADISKAARLLGWSPQVGLAEGLGEFVAWMRAATDA